MTLQDQIHHRGQLSVYPASGGRQGAFDLRTDRRRELDVVATLVTIARSGSRPGPRSPWTRRAVARPAPLPLRCERHARQDFPRMEGPMSPGAPARESTALDRLAINTIRFLAMDAVEQAKSGHPGLPMGMADVAHVLWTRFLRYRPAGSQLARPRSLRALGRSWLDAAVRDAASHRLRPADGGARALPPARQQDAWPSRARPDRRASRPPPGPLGQGFGNAVGMALAARMLAARVNTRRFRSGGAPHLRHRQRRRSDGRASRRRPRRSPVTRGSAIST